LRNDQNQSRNSEICQFWLKHPCSIVLLALLRVQNQNIMFLPFEVLLCILLCWYTKLHRHMQVNLEELFIIFVMQATFSVLSFLFGLDFVLFVVVICQFSDYVQYMPRTFEQIDRQTVLPAPMLCWKWCSAPWPTESEQNMATSDIQQCTKSLINAQILSGFSTQFWFPCRESYLLPGLTIILKQYFIKVSMIIFSRK